MHLIALVTAAISPHFFCLDVVDVKWNTASAENVADNAIIVEVRGAHAKLHTSVSVPCGALLSIMIGARTLTAEVRSCKVDGDYGYLVEVESFGLLNEEPDSSFPAWCIPAVDLADASMLLPC